jgi:hypothetical protein
MPVRSRRVVVVAGAGLVLLFASCDKSPTSPRPPQQSGPPPVTTVRIELVAPPEIAPDETVQLTANATKSDGSVENVSSQAQWTSATSEVLQLGSTGLATGRNRGEVFVTVRFGGLSATARIMVLPKGTFRLSGTVYEGGILKLENVTVTVTSGVGEGLAAVTNVNGGFVLYGVSGLVKLHARREGYVDVVHQVTVIAHRDHSLSLSPNRPLVDLSGTYTLTISSQSACPAAFPDAARRRSYTANVKQNKDNCCAGGLSVVLTGADFIVHRGWNEFHGRVISTGEARFYITRYDFDDRQLDIAERFGDTALLVRGEASAKATPELISGTLAGEILIAQGASPPFESYSSRCPAALFEMVRR